MKKRIMIAVMVVAFILGLMVPMSDVTVEAASMKLSKTKVTLTVGKTQSLSVKNIVSTSTVKWSTSDKKIATVSSKGKVTAKAAGTTTITANVTVKSGKISKFTCKVTVKAATSSKFRYVGIVYEGAYDLTISKVDNKGIPTEIIIYGEKIALKNQKSIGDGWSVETAKGGYMEIYSFDNYNNLIIKGNYGGEYVRTTRTDNEAIKTDNTIMKTHDAIEINDGNTYYTIMIAYDKSNTYYATKRVGSGDSKKETREAYPVTTIYKGEDWSFDCTTCTLTLDNANLTNIYTDLSCDITIKLIGDNIVCNDLPDGDLHSYQIAFFGCRDGIDKTNIIFTGEGSVNFSRPDWYKDDEMLRDSIGLRIFSNPLKLEGSCTVIVNGRQGGIESSNLDITVGKNCTLSIISEMYAIYPSSSSYSRKLTVDGTFIAEVTKDSEYATVFEGKIYSADGKTTPITPKIVIGSDNSIFAGDSAATAKKIDLYNFTAARYIRIGKE